MAKIQCSACGGKLVGGISGGFQCEACGISYDSIWAKNQWKRLSCEESVTGGFSQGSQNQRKRFGEVRRQT